MNSSFGELKKNRQVNFDKLASELNKASGKTTESTNDDRFWYPATDKAGNGYAVIRFLPPPSGEDVPFVRIWNHGFQGPTGSWYIENSLTTLGKNDPVGEFNNQLWNSGLESDKEQARKQKRKLTFISNIYVIEDPANPENEGKVFLFKYGKKIFDKVYAANNPEFKDETPIDPFDLWETGANFKIKIRNVEGYRNYDRSEFGSPGKLFEDEDKMERIWKQEHSLKEFLDPKHFKSYEELKAKLERVLGLTGGTTAKPAAKNVMEEDDDIPWGEPKAAAPKAAPAAAKKEEPADDFDIDNIMSIIDDE